MTLGSRPAVLNTRPRAQAAQLSWLLERAGFEAVEAPTIDIVPAWDAHELERVVRDLSAGVFAWVVLPSQNAGLMLADRLAEARVVCGSQTARALGLQPTHSLDHFSARAALDLLRPLIEPGQRILVPHAAEGRDELVDGLVAAGAIVRAPIAYRTVVVGPAALAAAAARLQRGEIRVVTVCSPTAVQSVLAAFDRDALARVPLVCLGETTADAARQAGLNVAGVAAHTTMASLVAAVAACIEVPA
jgi:uroporphyrinogen-III synthase